MCKKLIYLTAFALVLGFRLTSLASAANIILVTETRDKDENGIQDDQGTIDWLLAEGHNVNVQMDNWKDLDDANTPAKLAELNKADLVIVSRACSSGSFDDGNEPANWDAITAPLITLNAYLPRQKRLKWVESNSCQSVDDILMAADASHPIFDGVELIDGMMVIAYDNTVGAGTTTFLATTDLGNGTLIAQTLGDGYTAIAEWEAGVEMYPGLGYVAGGPRLLFAAGTQEIDGPPPTTWGEHNLTAEGNQMLRNAISYMASAGQ
ncbi:MAG: hypothetical protein GTO35_02915 [Gammaproteobacteria bacterium]|nr:hypothetical protein [Gammaproteobacteria bacterium]